jgi:hypothetical protein
MFVASFMENLILADTVFIFLPNADGSLEQAEAAILGLSCRATYKFSLQGKSAGNIRLNNTPGQIECCTSNRQSL